ncbi:unnamed protein product [Peniophora sp. CBMAI 1063]|nr:unnamed protein product [Peniophora sp. CBMAI 1063]
MPFVNVTIDPELDVVAPVAFFVAQRIIVLESILLLSLYALLLCTYLASLYYLWKHGLRSILHKVHLVTVSVMFGLTTAYIVSDLLYTMDLFDFILTRGSSSPARAAHIADDLAFATFSTTVVLGDAIILWRAALVCTWPRWLKLFCVIVILAQEASWVVSKLRGSIIVPEVISLAISLVATVAISARAWQHRRMLHEKIAMVSRRSALESILEILTETGILYTALWAVYIASHVPNPHNVTFRAVMTAVMTIVAPLYPTLIVIVVVRHKSHLEHQLTSIEPLTVTDPERLDFLPQEDSTVGSHSEFNPYDMIQKDNTAGTRTVL